LNPPIDLADAPLSRFAPLVGALAVIRKNFNLITIICVDLNFSKLYFKQLNDGALVVFGETALEFLGGDIKYAER
jgi:hypothetical protein